MILRRPFCVQRERFHRRRQADAWFSANAKVRETMWTLQHAVRRLDTAALLVAFLER